MGGDEGEEGKKKEGQEKKRKECVSGSYHVHTV